MQRRVRQPGRTGRISNSRPLNRDSSYLSHFDIETIRHRPSREKEGLKWRVVGGGWVRIRRLPTAFWG